MDCPKCGKPLAEGCVLCEECAAQESGDQEAVTAAEKTMPEIPVKAAADTCEGSECQKQKKACKWGWIITAGVALALVAALLLSWSSLEGLLARTLRSPEAYLVYVEEKAQGKNSVLDVAGSLYGTFRESVTDNTATAAEAAYYLTLGEELTSTLRQMLGGESSGIQLDWLKQLSLHTKTNLSGKNKGASLTLGLNGNPLFTADTILDTENYIAYVGVPEVNDTYLFLGVEDMGLDKQTVKTAVQELEALQAQLAALLPEEEAFEALTRKYTGLVISKLENVERTTETKTVNGITQEFIVLQTQVSEQLAKEIGIAVLEEAKTDEELYGLIRAMQSYGGMMEKYYASTLPEAALTESTAAEALTFEEFAKKIDSYIAELQATEADSAAFVVCKTYVDKQNDICGRAVIDPLTGEEMWFLIASDGENWAFEMVADQDAKLTGSGAVNKKLFTGSFAVREAGTVYLTIDVEDMDLYAMNSGRLLGTFRLHFGDTLLEALAEDTELPALSVATDLALELKLNEETCDVKLLNSGKLFVGLGIAATVKEAQELSLPAQSVSALDEAAAEAWVGQMNFDGVLEAMEAAGVPEAYMEVLELLAKQISG